MDADAEKLIAKLMRHRETLTKRGAVSRMKWGWQIRWRERQRETSVHKSVYVGSREKDRETAKEFIRNLRESETIRKWAEKYDVDLELAKRHALLLGINTMQT